MTILFRESDHKYFIEEKPEQKFVSVSGLFDMIKPKFDSIAISEKYSLKGREAIIEDLAKKQRLTKEQVLEKYGHLEFTPEDIRNIWSSYSDQRKLHGTKWHKNQEALLLSRGGKRGSEIEGELNRSIDLTNLAPGEYIELIISYPRLWLVGTADRVEILPNKEFIIRDWKTDNKLEYKGVAYFDKQFNEKRVRKLLPPLQHIDDVNGQHYNIKESLYIYFLESYGYKFKEGFIDHVQFNDIDEPIGVVQYPIEYKKTEVINLLNWYKNKK